MVCCVASSSHVWIRIPWHQHEKSKQQEGSRVSSQHRDTSDLCETDVREMTISILGRSGALSSDEDDDYFDEEEEDALPHSRGGGNTSSSSNNRARGRAKGGAGDAGTDGGSGAGPGTASERKTNTRGGANLYESVDRM